MKSTGFSLGDRQVILKRSYGWCEVCNKRPTAHLHHRKPRRMGGRSGAGRDDVNRPSNGLALCVECHDRIETKSRRQSGRDGLLLRDGQNPRTTPLNLPRYCGWVLFDDLGGVDWHQDHDRALRAAERIETENEHY